jgi:predicted DNA-binding WGR domain protein
MAVPVTGSGLRRRKRPARRRQAETPAVVSFRQYVCFSSTGSDSSRRSFYRLTWQASLLGGGLLVQQWGPFGTRGTSRAVPFENRRNAQETAERLIRRRLRRRFEVTEWM